MKILNQEMHLEKSTKNKHVYACDNSAVASIYIEKSALPSTPPETITIEITAGN